MRYAWLGIPFAAPRPGRADDRGVNFVQDAASPAP